MAGEVDDIVQNVVLTGNEEVASAFDKIREAGEKAFDSLAKAAENAFSFTGLATAIGGLAAAIGIAGVGVFEFVKHTEESVSQLSDLADQMGTTTESVTGLRAAFAAGGVSADTMQSSFRRLSLITQQTWAEIKKQSTDGKDQLAQDALAVSAASIAAAEAQQKAATISRDQIFAQKSDLNSVQDARLKLRELDGQDVSFEREQLTRRQALLSLDQARAKQADDLANAERERQKVSDAAEKSQLDLTAARKKESSDQKNDIGNVIDAVKKLADGNTDALKNINATTENLVKGIVGAAGEGDQALGKMRGDITDLASPAPEVKSVFEVLGKVLSNLSDPAEKTSLAFRTLGRNVSQTEINVISSAEKMAELRKRIEDLNLGINEVDKTVSEQFRGTLFGLQLDISLVAAKISTAFGPSATAVLQALDDALIKNKDGLIEFASALGGQVQGVVESFIRVLAGVPDAAKDDWLVGYISKLKLFGGAILDTISILARFAGAILESFDGVAKDLNSVFGTSLNGVDLLVALWVASIIQNLGILRSAILATGATFGLAFGPAAVALGLIAAGFYAVYQAYQTFQDVLGAQGAEHLNNIFDGTLERLHAIQEFLSGDFSKGLSDFAKATADQQERAKQIDEDAKKSTDDKKSQQGDLAKASSDLQKKIVDDQKVALTQVNADHKSSIDQRIDDLKRLADESQNAAEKQKANTQDQRSAAQTSPTSDANGTLDANGIRNFGSGGNLPAPESLLHALMTQFLNALPGGAKNPQNILDTEAFFGASFGIQSPVQGGPNSFPVLRNNDIGPTENPPLPRPRPIPTNGFEDFQRSQQDVNNPVPVKVVPDPAAPPTTTQNLVGDQEQVKSFFHDTVHDFLSKAFSDPGALTSPDRPDRQPTPQTNPNNLPDVGQSALSTAIESLGSKFDELISKLSDIVTKQQDKTITEPGQLGIRGDATDTTDQLQTAAENVANTIESGGQTVADALRVAAEAISTANGKGDTTSGTVTTAASGGYITGPGTTTSDSIWARLSNREFVHNAQAVAHYGVDFMHAINNMQIPRFNTGGLVGLLSPQLPRFAFASGGLVNTSTPHLGTVDLSTDHGLVRVTVDRNSISQLRKAAVMKNMGKDRQPSWVK